MPRWQSTLAHVNHVTLYAVLFVMPVAGYLGSVFSGFPVKYFGITLPAWGWKDPALKDLMSSVHYVASWILAGLVLLHIAGALKHALITRDGLVARMGLGRVSRERSPQIYDFDYRRLARASSTLLNGIARPSRQVARAFWNDACCCDVCCCCDRRKTII